MPSFTIKVPNNDEGEDLGTYDSDYLPRVGDSFVLWHPRVCRDEHHPFCGVVEAVTHEAHHSGHTDSGAVNGDVEVTVWLAEEHAAPTLYCDCFKEMQAVFGVDEDGDCENCGHTRKT